MKDLVGWSGIGPIVYFLEYSIGLQPDGPKKSPHVETLHPRNVAAANGIASPAIP